MDGLSIIEETIGKAREYAPLVVELYKGCSMSCKYCPVPRLKNISPKEFHKNNSPVENAIPRLKKDAELLREWNYEGEILLCFHSDPYQLYK